MVESREVFFVVGEPSGDVTAAQLATELLRRGPYRLTGAGGPRMRAVGVETDFDSTHWGSVGVADAVRNYPRLYRHGREIVAILARRRPAAVVYVDCGGINVRLARMIRRLPFHQPALYYFPPRSWDRTPRDRSALGRLVDMVATPFPWSAELLTQSGVPARFVGHPVVERLAPVADKTALRRELGLPPAAHYVGLLAGSRKAERRHLGPPLLAMARELAAEGDYHFLWTPPPAAFPQPESRIPADLAGRVSVAPDSRSVLGAADLVVTSLGTSTLEAAVSECPLIGAYCGSLLMLLQVWLAPVKTDFYAMPNIILQRSLAPEVLGKAVTGPNLAAQVRRYLDDPAQMAAMRAGLREVREVLGGVGASARTADLVEELIASRAGSPV